MHQDEELIRLLREINNGITKQMNHVYESYGLTSVQFFVLMELDQHTASSLSQLAANLHMSLSNISAIIKRMEQHDLVCRSRKKTDERIVMIQITSKAQTIIDAIKNDMCCDDSLQRCLSNSQKEEIIRSLRILNQMIQKEY